MNIINTFNDKRFILNGIQYFKNYVSVVRGNKIEIFNCYERKDVLVELTSYNQYSLNGTVYTSAALLQAALLPVIYSRVNMGDGVTFAQNNIGRTINLGFYTGNSSIQAIVTKMNNTTTVISAIDTPVVLSLYTLPTLFTPNQTPPNNKKQLYLFKSGAGTYGVGGTRVTTAMISQLATLNLTQEDIQSNPKAVIHNLGTLTNETLTQIVNKSIWDFSDSDEIDEDGHLKSYYFSYSKNDILYFDQFIGTPGIYGSGKIALTEKELITTTNSSISENLTLEQILAEGGNKNISQFTNNGDGISPFTTIAKLNGLTISVNQAAAEMYLKNSEGTTLATVNLAFLNNEGTTFFYNETTQKLELKNDAGIILSEVSVSAFVSNLMQTVNFNGANTSILEFKDAAGNVVDSATFTINNIAGLQAILDAKANSNGSNASGTWGINVTGHSNSISSYVDFANIKLGWKNTNEKLNIKIDNTDFGSTFPIDISGSAKFLNKNSLVNGDANLIYKPGAYTLFQTANVPFNGDGALLNVNTWDSTDEDNRYNLQIASPINGNALFYRGTDVIGSGTWKQLVDTNQLSLKANLNGGNSFHGDQHINGKIDLTSDSGDAYTRIKRGSKTVSVLGSYSDNPLIAILSLMNDDNENIRLYSGGDSWINGGNLGVGTVAPKYKLDLNGIGRFKRTFANGGGLAAASIVATDAKSINDGIGQIFQGHNSNEAEVSYGSLASIIESSVAGLHSSRLELRTYNLGVSTLALILNKNGSAKFYGEVEVTAGTFPGSAVNKSQIDLKANLSGGNNFIGDQNINGNVTVGQSVMIKNKLNLKGSTVDNWEFSVNESGSLLLKNIYQTATSYMSVDPITGELAIRSGTQSNSAVNKSQIDLKANLDDGNTFNGNQIIKGQITIIKDSTETSPNQLAIRSASNTSKVLFIGVNSDSGHGQIHAETAESNYNPIEINPVGGNILMGTTVDNGKKLQVAGSGSFTGEVTIAPATSKNNAVNLGQLGIQPGDAHEKGYLKSATFIGNDSATYQDNDLIGAKIKYVILNRGADNGSHITTILYPQEYTFNTTTGTILYLMGSLSYMVVNYVK